MRNTFVPCVVAAVLAISACRIVAQEPGGTAVKPKPSPIHGLTMNRIDGTPQKLADYAGKVLLVVNVASACGYTPQYEGLQKLHEKFAARGFSVLGFPSNDFGGQEPGSDAKIRSFCQDKFGVTFPMFSKVGVVGDAACALYRYLQQDSPVKATVKWNFHKFLLDGEGNVIATFGTKTPPDDPRLVAEIESALKNGAPGSRPATRPSPESRPGSRGAQSR